MARTVGSFIKDLRYDKWFTVGYKFLNETFVLCKNASDRFEFLSLERKQAEEENIFKLKTKSDAYNFSLQIPEINIGGYTRDIEVIPRYMIGEML